MHQKQLKKLTREEVVQRATEYYNKGIDQDSALIEAERDIVNSYIALYTLLDNEDHRKMLDHIEDSWNLHTTACEREMFIKGFLAAKGFGEHYRPDISEWGTSLVDGGILIKEAGRKNKSDDLLNFSLIPKSKVSPKSSCFRTKRERRKFM